MTAAMQWQAATAYPAATMPGLGLARFAELLTQAAPAAVALDCRFDLPLDAMSLLQAVVDGRLDIGDLYCGALSAVDPLFQIGSLPFQASTAASAMQLLAAARPSYQRKFEELGVHLLYVTPWPPTGLWTQLPIQTTADFAGLRIRTYDDMSAAVIRLAGGHARKIPIGEAFESLRAGELDGVLSSGDGAAGQRLAVHLRCFYNIRYAMPISFTVINSSCYGSLSHACRGRVDAAAREVERFLWGALVPRLQQNQDSMLAAGVQVFSDLAADLKQAMLQGGRSVTRDWERQASASTASLLGEYFPSPQGR